MLLRRRASEVALAASSAVALDEFATQLTYRPGGRRPWWRAAFRVWVEARNALEVAGSQAIAVAPYDGRGRLVDATRVTVVP